MGASAAPPRLPPLQTAQFAISKTNATKAAKKTISEK